jgi:methionyl-tRNA formyltransferase
VEKLLINHFKAFEAVEKKYFGGSLETVKANVDYLETENNTANSDRVYRWIKELHPDYLILFGCGIIKERLLSEFGNKCINMHLGLSPYYRGAGTNIWPLVNAEPECIGVTIHIATLMVDAGKIIRQIRPNIELNDSVHDIGCKAINVGAKILGKTINEYHANEIEVVGQDLSIGQVFRIADFSAEAIEKINENMTRGMISNYIENKEYRQRQFPIVG